MVIQYYTTDCMYEFALTGYPTAPITRQHYYGCTHRTVLVFFLPEWVVEAKHMMIVTQRLLLYQVLYRGEV